MGQEQLAAWPRDLQMALAPHGSTLHASRHVPSTHLSGSPQSRSVAQEGAGVTTMVLGVHTELGHMRWATFRFTFSVRSDERVIGTRAENCSDGGTVLQAAYLGVVTRPRGLARVLALVVDAGEPRAAVIVNSTLKLNRCRGYNGDSYSDTVTRVYTLTSDTAGSEESVAPRARVTRALGLVLDTATRGVLAARVCAAHGFTGLADEVTSLVLATVLITATLHIDTGHERVALQPRAAHALGRVELHDALGAPAAGPRRVGAGVQTVLIDAGLAQRTVAVRAALRPVALGVGVAPVALRTRAHGVVGTCAARGLGRTGVAGDARVDAVLVDAGLGLGTVRVLRTLGPGRNWNTTRVTMGHVDT